MRRIRPHSQHRFSCFLTVYNTLKYFTLELSPEIFAARSLLFLLFAFAFAFDFDFVSSDDSCFLFAMCHVHGSVGHWEKDH